MLYERCCFTLFHELIRIFTLRKLRSPAMKYKEISPDNRLKQYVKCYYIYESDAGAAFEDTVLPSGCVEIIFNLGAGKWQTDAGEGFVSTPAIELWGQIIRPLPVRSVGKK